MLSLAWKVFGVCFFLFNLDTLGFFYIEVPNHGGSLHIIFYFKPFHLWSLQDGTFTTLPGILTSITRISEQSSFLLSVLPTRWNNAVRPCYDSVKLCMYFLVSW